MTNMNVEQLAALIRPIKNWPASGVTFRDITPLFGNGEALSEVAHQMADRLNGKVDAVVGLEARGFIIGAAVARELGVGFIPMRKRGKLPYTVFGESYDLEYGKGTLEVHTDALKQHKKKRVAVIDDVVATGGSMIAALNLLERLSAEIVEVQAVIDLPNLGGSGKLKQRGHELFHILKY